MGHLNSLGERYQLSLMCLFLEKQGCVGHPGVILRRNRLFALAYFLTFYILSFTLSVQQHYAMQKYLHGTCLELVFNY